MQRSNRNQQNNNWSAAKIFWMFVLGFFIFGRSGEMLSILFFLAVAYGLYRWFSYTNYQSQQPQFGNSSTKADNAPVDPAEVARIRRNASQAMQRAGRNPKESPLRLIDIGVLVYEGSTQPQIYRSTEIGTDSTHIRPFMVVDNPDRDTTAEGIIRFNLIDEDGKLRFTNRSKYTVKPGQNFITPPTWLPLHDQSVSGKWSMHINIGTGDVFAIHEFGWFKVGGQLRAQFTGDGEIDEVAYSFQPGESLSLDELLAHQGEEAPLVMSAQR
jgi:hypothetical protein